MATTEKLNKPVTLSPTLCKGCGNEALFLRFQTKEGSYKWALVDFRFLSSAECRDEFVFDLRGWWTRDPKPFSKFLEGHKCPASKEILRAKKERLDAQAEAEAMAETPEVNDSPIESLTDDDIPF